uniref:Class I SAM-dependent methyltransferase n=1 Tax=Candidatus Methanomethylicus mesodigestus TaxID=1867258 RepID=A0A7C3J287_9CREN
MSEEMGNEKENKNEKKIYGYDEELWYNVLRSQNRTGERDIKAIDCCLRRLSPGKEILDLGCGTGRISNKLAGMGYSVTGIDLSDLCIGDAKRSAEELGISSNVTYFVGDYRNLELIADKKFDAALCILAPAWKSMDEMASIFGNLAAHMRENAILLLRETVKERFLTALNIAPSVQSWFRVGGDILSLHTWWYSYGESKVRATKEFYRRRGKDFEYVSRMEQEYVLRSLAEYTGVLERAGWHMEEAIQESVDLLEPENYNDPWWLYSALIVARRNKEQIMSEEPMRRY